jgi:hypothetical protein
MARSHGSRAESIRSFEIYDAIPVCDVPIGKQVLPGQWVITLTPQPGQANIVKFKVRFVARGDRIWSSNDPEDVYSPVSDAITRKLFLAIVADENFDCRQGDFNTAFLNAPLDEPVWMKSPPAFEETDVSGRPVVWPLKKALYGLSQAPLALKKHAAAVFADLGFRPIESDPCLFVRNRGGSKLMLLLYVDDFLLAGPTVQVNKAWAELETRFKIDDPWRLAPGRYLGMDVSSDRRAVHRQSLALLSLEKVRPRATPMDEKLKLVPRTTPLSDEERATMASVDYRAAIARTIPDSACARALGRGDARVRVP